MNFEDIKERIKELFQSITGRIAESSAWQQLSEKYADLPPQGQKAALSGAAFIGALLLISVPYLFYASSASQLDDFEGKKTMMREFFRINREANSLPPPPVAISANDLRNRIQNEITLAQLQPEQNGGITDFDNKAKASSWIPKTLQQSGVAVTLKKLNLQQIVDIGQKLQNIQPTAKMIGLEVHAQREDPHYFDVTYKLVAFSLPPEPGSKDAKAGAKPGEKPGAGKK